MSVCGVEFKASQAIFVLLEGSPTAFSHLNVKTKKIAIKDDLNSEEIRAFRVAVFTFFADHAVEKIVIKKRNKKGEFSGGPVGFKLEGLVQLYRGCPIEFIAPATLSSIRKKHNPDSPSTLLKYQQGAFEAAFAGLV